MNQTPTGILELLVIFRDGFAIYIIKLYLRIYYCVNHLKALSIFSRIFKTDITITISWDHCLFHILFDGPSHFPSGIPGHWPQAIWDSYKRKFNHECMYSAFSRLLSSLQHCCCVSNYQNLFAVAVMSVFEIFLMLLLWTHQSLLVSLEVLLKCVLIFWLLTPRYAYSRGDTRWSVIPEASWWQI